MKEKKINVMLGIVFISLIAALSFFFILISIEKKMMSEYAKVQCIVVKEAIPDGKIITEEDLSNYFAILEVDAQAVPEQYVTEQAQLLNLQTQIEIPKGSVISMQMFHKWNEEIEKMENPVLAGVKSEDLYQVVSGTLRGGDHVNIYTVDAESGESFLVWENILVKDAFDANGNPIYSENEEVPAARLNIFLEKGVVDYFYELMNQGSLRVVKVWEK